MARLIARGDSLLLVIDAQPGFYGASSGADAGGVGAVLERVAWLAGVAAALRIPTVVTEEDAARNGPTADVILAAVAPGTPVLGKVVFGAADQPDILAAIEASGRRTAVVAGLETDVCVAHTSLGLTDRGFRVAVVHDATFAPGAGQTAGIARMAGAGVSVVTAKGLYYEWVRTLEAARAFEREHPGLASPPGFDL